MDPATIFQIVGTVVSLGDVVIKCIARLSTLKAQFHDAPIIVTSMIGQLHMVKIAQDQLSILNSPAFTHDPRYHQLAAHIGNALDSFSPILLALGQQLDRYEGVGADRMAAKTRLGFLNGEREMTNLSVLLDRQVNALNLLLQAIQCTTWTQQSEVITREESQSILRLAQDCSSSLLGLDDVASFISENTAAISTHFEFDDVLRSTLLYQTAERSHLRQAIRAKRKKNVERTSTDNISQRAVTFGIRQAFRTMKLSSPIEQSKATANQLGIKVHIQHETIVETSGANDSMQQKDPRQEDPVNISGEPAQTHLGRSDSSSARLQTSLGNWRKAFQRRTSSASGIRLPRDQHKGKLTPKKTKVLLLGASGSGKTTLLNALQLFTEAERVKLDESYYRTLVWQNALDAVRILLRELDETGTLPAGQRYASALDLLLDPCPDCEQDPALNPKHASEVAFAITALRENAEFQVALESRDAYQFHDNSKYYIENLDRFVEQAIHRTAPTNGDVLRTQVTTTGIHKTVLTYGDTQYLLHDFGGERSERKKWIHAFQDVSTVVYPVETTGYRRVLREDRDGDRMHEQFMVWESIVNSFWFKKSNFLIVFTKMDLLDEYLKLDGFRNWWNGEGRAPTVEDYLGHLKAKFLELIKWPESREEQIRERVRIVCANLVDVETHKAAIDVMDALGSFNQPRKSQLGNHTVVARQPGEGYVVTLVDENRELSEKAPVSRPTVDSSSETSSFDAGRLSARGTEDTNALLVGMAR